MEKRKMHDMVNFDQSNGGKLELYAENYDFKLLVSKYNSQDKKFINSVEVPLKPLELFNIAEAVINPFIQEANRLRFKVKELQMPHTIGDIRYTTSGLNTIRLVGQYVMDERGFRNKQIKFVIYKFENWDEVKRFNSSSDLNEFNGKIISTYYLPTSMPIAKGSYVYSDMVSLDMFTKIAKDCFYKDYKPLSIYLEEVYKESQIKENNQEFKPKEIKSSEPTYPAMDPDEFPF